MRGHLHLVSSSVRENDKQTFFINHIGEVIKRLNCIFISEKEKIYMIKDALVRLYRDYEITTGYNCEPYFIRAEKKLRRIIREKKVNHYYNLLKRENIII